MPKETNDNNFQMKSSGRETSHRFTGFKNLTTDVYF